MRGQLSDLALSSDFEFFQEIVSVMRSKTFRSRDGSQTKPLQLNEFTPNFFLRALPLKISLLPVRHA
ncbi:MAG: hypothetical protein OXI87_25125 [Albidovulum sp.]|nr:hypothetical protein [Albidovulum sp.]